MSPRAAQLLNEIRATSDIPAEAGVRVYAEQTTGDEVSIGVGFIDNPVPGDEVSERDGVKLFVAPEVAGPLGGTIIDVTHDDGESQLVFTPQDDAPGAEAARERLNDP
jgi:Fe-S cluster assembly iron-binding protein IscA